jgi:hypothetical protein
VFERENFFPMSLAFFLLTLVGMFIVSVCGEGIVNGTLGPREDIYLVSSPRARNTSAPSTEIIDGEIDALRAAGRQILRRQTHINVNLSNPFGSSVGPTINAHVILDARSGLNVLTPHAARYLRLPLVSTCSKTGSGDVK